MSYKRIILDNIGEKDIEFFDLYKTDEIMLSIAKNEHILEYNFFFYAIETFLDIYNFFYLLFYLNTSSFTLTILYFLVQGFKLLSDFLLTKFSNYKQRGKLAKIFNEYNSILYEFIDNIRLIKSMCIEEVHLNKLYPLKNAITHQYCTLESILESCIDFVNEILDTFIVFVAGKYTIFDKINYSDLTIFQNYTNQLGTSFNSLKNIHRNYIDLYNLWKEFFEIYDYENKVISLKDYIPENENNFEFSIEFKNVKFAYPARPKAIIFNDLSLTIE
jgi:ABC-type multidrug transport system fused ATPase/permease subunit